MFRIILKKIGSRPLISTCIILLSLAISSFLGVLLVLQHTWGNEIDVLADRHYGDIVVVSVLKDDGKTNQFGKNQAQQIAEEQIRNSSLPTFVDVKGFSKPAEYSTSEYRATYIPYFQRLLPFLETKEWFESAIGRQLRLVWFYSSGANVILDDADNDVMITDISGVNLNDLIAFDYSFKDVEVDSTSLDGHGIFISEYLKHTIEQETGKQLGVGDYIHIGYPASEIGNPRLVSCFYLPLLGIIPDTGGRLNNGSESRTLTASAYVDMESMVRLFQLDASFSSAAFGNGLPNRNLNSYDPENPSFVRRQPTDEYQYYPNQVSIRIKDGFDRAAVLSELQEFLDSDMNTSYVSSGRYTVFPSEEYLGYGAAGLSSYDLIQGQKEKIRLFALIVVVMSLLIIFELFYAIYVEERNTVLFLRSLGANRSAVFWYCLFFLLMYLLPSCILGMVVGAFAGMPVARDMIGFALFPLIPILIAILILILSIAGISFLMAMGYLREQHLSAEVI